MTTTDPTNTAERFNDALHEYQRAAAGLAPQHVSAAAFRMVALPSAPAHAWYTLTARQREVARLAAEGLTDKEIALACAASRRTVERHLVHIRAKLLVRNRAQLAAWVVRNIECS